MKQAALVIIKPDGIRRRLEGEILKKFAETGLELVAAKPVKPSRELLEEHYKHIRKQKFFGEVVDYLLGKYHKGTKVLALVYFGEDAVRKCRKVAGATNPEEADPLSLRGAFGRITTDGVYENVVHVSSDKREAEREIKLWFSAEEIQKKIYPTVVEVKKIKVWK